MNSKPEIYKDIVLDNPESVSKQLGKMRTCCQKWMNNHPGKTMKDYVDFSKPEIYKGIVIDNPGHVSRQLGKHNPYACKEYLHNHPDKTMKDYVDFSKRYENVEIYKGIILDNVKHVSKQLGRTKAALYDWINRHPGKTIKDYIDFILQDQDYYEVYKDIILDNQSHISTQVGKSKSSCCIWLKHHPGKTVKDYVDFVKG